MSARYPRTPDGRYFVASGRLWRCTDPSLSEEVRTDAVKALMAARRAVKDAPDETALRAARDRVNAAKIRLGERGPVWWDDGAPDLTGRAPWRTAYAAWWEALSARETAQSSSGQA